MAENRSFWENEEKKLDERVYQAMWPGGEKAVERLIKQEKQPVRELISKPCDTTEFIKFGFRIDEFADKFPTQRKTGIYVLFG